MMKNPGSYILGVYFRFSLLRQALWAVIAMPPVVLLLAVVFHSSESVTRPVGWEQSFFVSPGGIKAKNVDAASSGKYVAAVYEGFSGGENAIYVSVSFNGGVSYMKDIKIAPVNTVIDNNPRVAVAGNGHLFVAWQNHVVTEATNRMFYSRSTDMGATWSEPRQINIGTEIEMLPRVFYDDRNRLHLFYNAFAEGAFTLFHAESADESTFVTINSILRLTPDMKGAFFPAIHFSGNNIFLVWQGKGKRYTDDLFLIESSNYGKTWSSIDQITRALSSNTSPSIIMKGDTLYLAYQNNDSKSWAIKMLIREAGRWSPEPVVISQTEANCYSPALAFSREDELLVTWYDTRDGKTRIFSRRFDMLKGSLLDEQRISTREDAALSPRVVSSGSKAVVFWESGSRIESKYTDVYVAPPKVMSQTHPDGVWTRNSTARIEWTPPEDESGIVGYASIVTRPTGEGIMPDVNPTVQNYSAVTRRVVLPELTDGITYFHIRAIDGAGNMSRTIHYRIQVSAHPMPMPVVVSPTHPQGKSEKEAAPRLVWSVEDLERLKGFVYSLSRDYVRTPMTFTQDFEAIFSDLETGNYFFSIAAIDKTDQRSQVADYFFTVGNPGKISPEEMLEKLKHRDLPDNRGIAVIRKPPAPSIQITLPFDASRPLEESAFRGLLVARNISAKRMEGYSVYIGNIDREAPMTVSQKENVISVDDLKSGEYYISARGQYRLGEGGAGRLVWTDPVKLRLSVKIPDYLSPVQHYGLSMLQRFSPRAAAVTVFIMGMSVLIIAMGFGGRLAFYGRLLRYKAMSMAHIIF